MQQLVLTELAAPFSAKLEASLPTARLLTDDAADARRSLPQREATMSEEESEALEALAERLPVVESQMLQRSSTLPRVELATLCGDGCWLPWDTAAAFEDV